jgi:uncharacterized protein YhfF
MKLNCIIIMEQKNCQAPQKDTCLSVVPDTEFCKITRSFKNMVCYKKSERKFDLMNNQEEMNSLPPKTCSIERLVTKEEDVQKVLEGKKTATRRNGRYADIGEIMELKGKKFAVEKVYSQTLGELTDEHARQEGYDSVEEYKQSILSFHPGMPWLPQMSVWVHEFTLVNE